MTEVFPGLPELHEKDPRLCPGRSDYQLYVDTDEGVPDWAGPAPFSGPHEFGGDLCRWCIVSKDQVRERFRDWRYECLVEQLLEKL